jgi:hypothetical protein
MDPPVLGCVETDSSYVTTQARSSTHHPAGRGIDIVEIDAVFVQ